MKLWTIQPIETWELFNKQGYYHGTFEYIMEFPEAYDWMKKQLVIKIGINKEYYPVWAWVQKPDLRTSGHLDKGKKGVLLELNVDENEVLISDFDLWHYVLNYWYLPISEEDGDKFDKKLESKGLSYNKQKPLPEPYNSIVEDSWQRIFDLDWVEESITGKQDNKWFQTVFWDLKIEQVKKVKEFISR